MTAAQERAAAFRAFLSQSEIERDKIIETGFFDDYIIGYACILMKHQGRSQYEIESAKEELQRLITLLSAEKARNTAKNY